MEIRINLMIHKVCVFLISNNSHRFLCVFIFVRNWVFSRKSSCSAGFKDVEDDYEEMTKLPKKIVYNEWFKNSQSIMSHFSWYIVYL